MKTPRKRPAKVNPNLARAQAISARVGANPETVLGFLEPDNEPQIVDFIKTYLRTPRQKDALEALDLSIEDMLNGRYNTTQEPTVLAIFMVWNERLGDKYFSAPTIEELTDTVAKVFRAVAEPKHVTDEVEGDRTTWHIRLVRHIEGVGETWALFNGERCESSEFPKASVQKMRDEELAKVRPAAPTLDLAAEDLGKGYTLVYQRSLKTQQIRAVIREPGGEIWARGTVQPETLAGATETRLSALAALKRRNWLRSLGLGPDATVEQENAALQSRILKGE